MVLVDGCGLLVVIQQNFDCFEGDDRDDEDDDDGCWFSLASVSDEVNVADEDDDDDDVVAVADVAISPKFNNSRYFLFFLLFCFYVSCYFSKNKIFEIFVVVILVSNNLNTHNT